MNPRSFLLSLVALPLAIFLAHAQPRRIATPKAPAFLFADPAAGRVHALTAGVDINFNGIFEPDSGDMLPRWYVIDAATERVVDTAAFDAYFSSFPIRPGVDLAHRLLYIAQRGRVRAYSIDSLAPVRDTVALGFFSGVSYDSIAGRLALHARPGFTDPGILTLRNPVNGDTLAEIRTGVNPNMTVSERSPLAGLTEYYTLSEGTFGAPTSRLGYAMAERDIYSRMNGHDTLGGGGSALVSKGNYAAVALGGGHEVSVIDARTHRNLPYSPISFGKVGSNGPRTLAFQGDSVLLVGTYSGELIRVRLADGAVLDTLLFGGKLESIAVRDSVAYVAFRLKIAGNTDDSTVISVNLNTLRPIDTLQVNAQPAAVVVGANGDIHVLGGTSDSTRWWITFDGATHQQKSSHTFSGFMFSPFHFYHDEVNDTLYAAISDTLRAYPLASAGADYRVVYVPTNPFGTLLAVSDGGEYLLAIESTVTGKGAEYLHVVDRSGTLLAKFRTSLRPIMAARVPASHDRAVGIYVLNRGVAGAQFSTLDLFEFHSDILGPDTLGSSANHIAQSPIGMAITVNGSHEVAAVRYDNWSVASRVSTGTSGFDGPRESVFLPDGHLIVSTYAGDIRSLNPGGNYRTYPIGGKGEGITALGSKVFTASIFDPFYTPDTAVVVFDAATLGVTLEREDAVAAAALDQNFPNPASSATSIRFAVDRPGRVTLELYTAEGRLVRGLVDETMTPGSYTAKLELNGLPAGAYLYTLRANGKVETRTMQVVR